MAGDPRPKQGLVRRSVRRTRFDREYAAIRPQILAPLTALLLLVGCQPPGDAKKTATKKTETKVYAGET